MTPRTYYRLIGGIALISTGVLVAVVGYLGVSRELEVAFQLPYFASAGIGALLLFGGGATLLLSLQLERDTDRLADLEDAVRLLAGEVQRLADELEGPSGVPHGGNGRTSESEPAGRAS